MREQRKINFITRREALKLGLLGAAGFAFAEQFSSICPRRGRKFADGKQTDARKSSNRAMDVRRTVTFRYI